MVEKKIEKIELVNWVDISRGIGIFLVVIIHTSLPKMISNYIVAFIMPFFFCISGYLYRENKYKSLINFAWIKFKHLIFPYICFTLIVWIGFYFLNYKMSQYSVKELLLGWNGIALWFVPVLFMSEITFAFLQRKFKNLILLLILTLFSMAGYTFYYLNLHLPYKIEVVFIATFFYGIGFLYKEYINSKFHEKYKKIIFILSIILGFSSFLITQVSIPTLDITSNTFGNYIPSMISALFGITSFVSISYLFSIEKSNITSIIIFLGRNTFVILSLHQLILMILKKYMENLPINNYFNSGIRHLLQWLILYICIIIINKHLPFLLGKSKKII